MKNTESTAYKSTRSFVIGSVAIAAGLLAAWAAHEHLAMRELEIENKTIVVNVERVVAAGDLSVGTILDNDHLAMRSIPQEWAPKGAYKESAAGWLVGRSVAVDVKRGDILLPVHLAPSPELPISERVPAGRRAVTLAAGEIQAASGVLNVDDLIDLYVSFTYQNQQVTAPVAQGARVLALSVKTSPAVITLDLAEHDAVKVAAARRSGSLTAMLRRRSDTHASTVVPTGDLAALIGIDKPASAAPVIIPILYGDRVNPYTAGSDHASIPDVHAALPLDAMDSQQ